MTSSFRRISRRPNQFVSAMNWLYQQRGVLANFSGVKKVVPNSTRGWTRLVRNPDVARGAATERRKVFFPAAI
jgi:hypothetical protein